MSGFAHDLRYAVRQLRAAPVFAISAILTLAIGIGANTTVLNLVNATLLKPPPVARPHELAWVAPMERNGRYGQWSLPKFIEFREGSRSWSGLAALGNVDLALAGDTPLRLSGQGVTSNYFDVLGVRPAIGRGFLAEEDGSASQGMPVVLSHALWETRFQGDTGVVGSTVLMNQQAVIIVGVAPEAFNGIRIGEECDFWVPMSALRRLERRFANVYTGRDSRWLRVIGRLAEGTEIDEARAEAVIVHGRIEADVTPAEDRRRAAVLEVRGGLDPMSRAKMAPVIALLMLVPLLVLAVACANVANLFVSRGVQRQKELGVRCALGASRGRLVRQLLTECALLGIAGGVVGVGFSYALTAAIVSAGDLPQDIGRLLVPDLRVFALTFVLAVAAGAVFGLLPALAATRHGITPVLKGDGAMAQAGRGSHRLRNGFVIAQVALSLSLLITAGLFVGSLQKALRVDPGYDPRNAIAMPYDLRGLGYDSARVERFGSELLARTAGLPGVEGVALASLLPLSGSSWTTTASREGDEARTTDVSTMISTVSPGYFATMRIPLALGRSFTDADGATMPRVVVINEQLAAMLWPEQNPIGKRLRLGSDPTLTEVIGIARNGKYRRLSETAREGYMWFSSTQRTLGPQATLVVRGATRSGDAANAARHALEAIDPHLPAFGIETLEAIIARTAEAQRSGAALLGVFGTIALALAACGIFGVIAQGVAMRRKEIGIRMSLGARGADVVRSFVREGLTLTVVGVGIGVAMSLAASQVLSSLLFGLGGTDLVTFAAATTVFLGIAALASFIPARRAARVDPMIALRGD
jgi:predicted permease